MAACSSGKESQEVRPSATDVPARQAKAPASPVRFVLNEEPARSLPSIAVETPVPLATLVGNDAQAQTWLRVEAKSKSGKILSISIEAYPNHHACVLRRADETWSLGWFRGQRDLCTSPDTALRIEGLRNVRLFTEYPKREQATSSLRLVWGRRAESIDGRLIKELSLVSLGEPTRKRGKATSKPGNAGAPISILLKQYGSADAVRSITIVDADGGLHELPRAVWTGNGAARVKLNRKGEYSIRWLDAAGKKVRLRGPKELRISP